MEFAFGGYRLDWKDRHDKWWTFRPFTLCNTKGNGFNFALLELFCRSEPFVNFELVNIHISRGYAFSIHLLAYEWSENKHMMCRGFLCLDRWFPKNKKLWPWNWGVAWSKCNTTA